MGKGDKKTRRGKIQMGSYGVKRLGKTAKSLIIKKDVVEVPKPEKVKKSATKPKTEDLPKVETIEAPAIEVVAEAPKKSPKKAVKKAKDAAE